MLTLQAAQVGSMCVVVVEMGPTLDTHHIVGHYACANAAATSSFKITLEAAKDALKHISQGQQT